MPSETLQGVVLRHANYRDRDRMLTLLTPDRGRVDVLARGCRKPKSPLMPAAEVFVHGEFVLFRQNDRFTLTSCALTDTFYPLRLDAYRLTCATYLLNLAQTAAQPEQPAEGLYALLLKGLYHLAYCEEEPPLAVTNAFLLLYAAEIGYKPRLNHCARCREPIAPESGARLDIEAGGLCCNRCALGEQYPLTSTQVAWMRQTLRDGFDTPLTVADVSLFEAMRRYVESRLETTVKSSRFLP
ncbi:MAG: DNA repair protein RecO [Clostridiales bacterium]|nr:DNA repair protein RecO [Clostridiales bacterium]